MTPTDIEVRLRSYLNDLTSTTPLPRPHLPRDSQAMTDQSETSATIGQTVHVRNAGRLPVGAEYRRGRTADPDRTPRRRGRLLAGVSAAVVIVAGLALAVVYGPRSSDVGGRSAEKTTTATTPTSPSNLPGEIVPIDTTTDRPGPPIHFDGGANIIWVAPDGRTLYVAGGVAGGTGPGGAVIPIETSTDRVLPAIPVGLEPSAFAMTPNEKVLFVLDEGGGTTGAQGGDITPIDTLTDQTGAPILPDTAPTSMVMTPNGKTLYVTDDGFVYAIDVATDQAGPPITVPGGAYASAVTPDGKTVYLTDGNGGDGSAYHRVRAIAIP